MSYTKNMKRVLLTGVATASLSVALPAVSSTAAYAQDYTSGIINGVIQDTSGSVVSGATITVVSEKGTTRTTTSDANGNFRIPRLDIGKYQVTVSAAGRDTLTAETTVGIGDAPLTTFTLAIPGAIDTVVAVGVSTGAWEFNSTTSGISVDVDELMDQTPVGRNVTAIALLAPGTTRGDATFGNLASFSGASVAENSYYVNGMNITEYRNFLGSSTIPFDFIQAVDVKTSGYSAEFGRATGGVISNVTRSGSNEFKAGMNVYWTPNFLRSNQKNITTNINQFEDADTLDYNVWASGPLIKDKLFFAGLYQWRDREWNNYNTSTASFSTDTSSFWGVKFDFTEAVKLRFDQEGISIPFPQMDVHVHKSESE